MTDIKTLNAEQLEAISHGEGPLLIIAGAGTGKTTVITERIKHLILKKGVSPSQILALTFTDKASAEMEERIDIAMPYGYTQMWISTFHAFCDRILRDEAHAIGMDSGYKLISESESVLLLRKNIFDIGLKLFRPLGNPTKFLDALLTHFSRLKEERKIQNIAKFFDRIKNFETERADANIFILAEWLNLMLQMGDSPQAADIDLKDRNAVNILTVHSSKGLEFKVVFLVNLVSDRFPSRERSEKIPLPAGVIKESIDPNANFHLEEERRLFYVGMTRAKERLYFTTANYYGMGKRIKKLSPFVYEASPELQKNIDEKNTFHQLSLTEILSVYDKQEEKEEEKIPLKLNYITFSNLQSFDICPLHYKAKVIFNIPTPTAAVQSFGISIHSALYNFYKKIREGSAPSLKELHEILKNEWISEGYNGKKHEEERFAQGIQILEDFYNTELKIPKTTLGLELPFSFVLKNGVKVFGKIDRVDKKGEGIEIIDYKTGLDNPKADKAHKLQLAMYALAATRVKDNILNRDPKDITLTLHFLEGNTKKSMNFKQEDLDKLENDLIEKISEIEKNDFKCSKNMLCVNCEYKMLCNTN